MTAQGYVECLASADQSGTNRASFTTAVSLLPTRAVVPITPDRWRLGSNYRLRAAGEVSNVVTAQPTFTFEFRLGPTANIAAWSSGAILTSTTAHTTVPWLLDVMLRLDTVGASTTAKFFGQGVISSRAFIDAGATADITTLGHTTLLVPETTPAAGTGWDSTVINLADFYAACSVSNASNAIRLHQYTLESLD